MRYRPELDGLRAFAVVAVLLGHVGTTITLGNLKQFYIRRTLRLYPALLLMLLGGLLFYQELGDQPAGAAYATLTGYATRALLVGTYMMDFAFGLTGHPFGEMSHTWSLAVEEQFYLLWPVALAFFLRRKRNALNWSIAITFASHAFRLFTAECGVSATRRAK